MIENGNWNMSVSLEPWRLGVTIGIPLYNEESFIEATIRSAAPQCELLLVSDNCSNDRSAEICQALALEYSNMVYIRHAGNLGATKNFEFVMTEAKTPYFMWLGAHDLIPPNYVRHLRASLDTDSTASLAFGASTHLDRQGNEIAHYKYTFSKLLSAEDPAIRLHSIIKYLIDCSLIHGLFRASDLTAAWREVDMKILGGDHVLLARLALTGKFLYVPATSLLRRDVHLSDSHSVQLERITGRGQQKGGGLSKCQMQKSQYELVTQISQQLGWRGPFFRLKAHYWLAFRLGPFSEGRGSRFVEKVVYQIYRAVRFYRSKRHEEVS